MNLSVDNFINFSLHFDNMYLYLHQFYNMLNSHCNSKLQGLIVHSYYHVDCYHINERNVLIRLYRALYIQYYFIRGKLNIIKHESEIYSKLIVTFQYSLCYMAISYKFYNREIHVSALHRILTKY